MVGFEDTKVTEVGGHGGEEGDFRDHTLIRSELGRPDIVQSASQTFRILIYTRPTRFDDKQTLLYLLK